MRKKISEAFICLCLLLCPSAFSELLYSDGEWDFESGFYSQRMEERMGPVAQDRIATVGNGWEWWSEQVLYDGQYFGFGVLNENKFEPNVSNGIRSQEITMTFATGWAGIYRTFDVPAGHRLRIEYDVKSTWSEFLAVVYLGVSVDGGIDYSRTSPTTSWYPWGKDYGPTEPPSAFYEISQTVVSTGERMTVFLAELHEVPTSPGATVMLDNIRIFDDGPAQLPTSTPTPAAKAPTVMTR